MTGKTHIAEFESTCINILAMLKFRSIWRSPATHFRFSFGLTSTHRPVKLRGSPGDFGHFTQSLEREGYRVNR